MIRLYKATNRNTRAHWVGINGLDVLFSYETPIAFAGGGVAYRRANDWGPTTGRHIRECLNASYQVIDDEDKFNALLQRAVDESIMKNLREKVFKNVSFEPQLEEVTA